MTVGGSDAGFNEAEWRAELAPHVRNLPQREQRILYLRFVEDLTQSEIAEQIGLSQMHVSRLLRSSLAALRDAYAEARQVGEGAVPPLDEMRSPT